MIMKTKTLRDRRRIATSRGYVDFEYKPLQNHDWNLIQDKLRMELSPTLREHLSNLTVFYAAATIPRSTRPLSDVAGEIDLWCRQTEGLIKKVWAPDSGATRPKKGALSLKQISEHYFRFSQNIVSASYPLSQLAHFLEGAVAIGNYFVRVLKDPKFRTDPKTELWLIWVALLISICRDNGIEPTKVNSTDLNPGFVFLLKKLQGTLDAHDHSPVQPRKASSPSKKRIEQHPISSMKLPIKTGASLAKNARRALALIDEDTIDDLLIFFFSWIHGLHQVGAGKFTVKEMKPTLERLNAQLKSISPKRNVLNG
jgi:hypothetical protein